MKKLIIFLVILLIATPVLARELEDAPVFDHAPYTIEFDFDKVGGEIANVHFIGFYSDDAATLGYFDFERDIEPRLSYDFHDYEDGSYHIEMVGFEYWWESDWNWELGIDEGYIWYDAEVK